MPWRLKHCYGFSEYMTSLSQSCAHMLDILSCMGALFFSGNWWGVVLLAMGYGSIVVLHTPCSLLEPSRESLDMTQNIIMVRLILTPRGVSFFIFSSRNAKKGSCASLVCCRRASTSKLSLARTGHFSISANWMAI